MTTYIITGPRLLNIWNPDMAASCMGEGKAGRQVPQSLRRHFPLLPCL